MTTYVLTTQQDAAPFEVLPANGTTGVTVDTTDATTLGGTQWLPFNVEGTPMFGTVGAGGSGPFGATAYTGTPGQVIQLQACFTAFVAATIDDTSPLATFELQVDGNPLPVSPVNTVSSIAAEMIPAGGRAGYFVSITLVATVTIEDALEHIYQVKATAALASTTILIGGTAPLTNDGRFNIWRNVAA